MKHGNDVHYYVQDGLGSIIAMINTTYGFALDGRRVSKEGAVDLKYLYDGENVIYELWDDKEVRFTHPVKSNSCSGDTNIFFTDHPISISIDGVKYYYLYDGLGSVTELIDENENVVNSYRYTPFGEALVRDESVYNPHQFTGRQYDEESGMYHYRARAYDADAGRFLQQDPAGMIDGANMYAYCGNNPVNRVDPSGDVSSPGNLNRYPSILFDGSYADRPKYVYGMYHDPNPHLSTNPLNQIDLSVPDLGGCYVSCTSGWILSPDVTLYWWPEGRANKKWCTKMTMACSVFPFVCFPTSGFKTQSTTFCEVNYCHCPGGWL